MHSQSKANTSVKLFLRSFIVCAMFLLTNPALRAETVEFSSVSLSEFQALDNSVLSTGTWLNDSLSTESLEKTLEDLMDQEWLDKFSGGISGGGLNPTVTRFVCSGSNQSATFVIGGVFVQDDSDEWYDVQILRFEEHKTFATKFSGRAYGTISLAGILDLTDQYETSVGLLKIGGMLTLQGQLDFPELTLSVDPLTFTCK